MHSVLEAVCMSSCESNVKLMQLCSLDFDNSQSTDQISAQGNGSNWMGIVRLPLSDDGSRASFWSADSVKHTIIIMSQPSSHFNYLYLYYLIFIIQVMKYVDHYNCFDKLNSLLSVDRNWRVFWKLFGVKSSALYAMIK